MTIVPESKNWTWVLERQCPDCRFDAVHFDRQRGPAEVRSIIARWETVLARPDARVRAKPTMWSPLEYGCHVRDVFRIFDGRLERMLNEHEPRYANWDQDVTAIEDHYDAQDPKVVAGELRVAGELLAERMATVSGPAWERKGLRSDGATFTVDSFLRYLLHDPIHHLWDVGDSTCS